MASSGKKGKTKWKAVDPNQIINSTTSRKITTGNWADESNDPEDSYDFGRKPEVTLPTAPRAARGPENDAKIPQEPPFQAYLSNLSYEVTEEDLAEFFSLMRVKSVRLPRDDRGNTIRAKGFGYVEFEDRLSLIEALSLPDTNLKNRRMRIEVAEGDQGRSGRGGPRDRGPNEPDRTLGDWRSGPRSDSDSVSSQDAGYRSGPRRDYGMDRGGSFGDRRPGGFRDDDRDRGGFRRDGDRPGFRDNRSFKDDRGGGGMYRDSGGGGDRYDRRGFDDRRDERREFGGGDRSTWRRDEPKMDRERDRDLDRGEPKTRTKLNLQPRTRPVEERVNGDALPTAPQSTPTAANAASIFGGARPVDTAAREREIEERLAKGRDDRVPAARDENRTVTAQPQIREMPVSKEEEPSSPSLEPAPPPKENVWARRSQATPQVNNGRISPHEESDSHKNRKTSPSKEPRKYQTPRRVAQDDRKRDEKNAGPRGGSGGGSIKPVDTRQPIIPKSREQKKDISDDTIKMPKLQEHQAPNFVGSNKYAFLEDSESAAD